MYSSKNTTQESASSAFFRLYRPGVGRLEASRAMNKEGVMNIRPTEIVLIPREQATLGRVDFRGVVTDEAAEIKSGDRRQHEQDRENERSLHGRPPLQIRSMGIPAEFLTPIMPREKKNGGCLLSKNFPLALFRRMVYSVHHEYSKTGNSI